MKSTFLTIILFCFYACSPKYDLILGSSYVHQNNVNQSKILIPSGSLYESDFIKHKGGSYNIAINKNEKIVYISTTDPRIYIDGLSIHNKLSDIYNNSGAKKNEVEYASGWGYYIKINSEWYAAFDYKSVPTGETKIGWFFKYKFGEGNKKLFE
jgi:hypothetical protein